MKTEIYYRKLKDDDHKILTLIGLGIIEPVTVYVGDVYKKVPKPATDDDFTLSKYEKVTHFLPATEESLVTETSDDYDYVLLKEGDVIRDKDEVYYNEDDQWISGQFVGFKVAENDYPFRRKVSKSELQRDLDSSKGSLSESIKEVESLKIERVELQKKVKELEQLDKHWKTILEMQKETIESQKEEIEQFKKISDIAGKLWDINQKELGRLKSELKESKKEGVDFSCVFNELEKAMTKFSTWPTDPIHALAVLGEEFGELTKEVLQLTYEPHKSSKELVKKEAIQCAAMSLRFVFSLDLYEYKTSSQHSQKINEPQSHTIDDEAFDALERYKKTTVFDWDVKNESMFLEGFKAAKEAQNG